MVAFDATSFTTLFIHPVKLLAVYSKADEPAGALIKPANGNTFGEHL